MQSENVGTVMKSTFTECEAAVETGEVTCQNMHQIGCMQVETGYECDARAADIVTNTLVGSVTQVVHQQREAARAQWAVTSMPAAAWCQRSEAGG